jgi:hypothetical protein
MSNGNRAKGVCDDFCAVGTVKYSIGLPTVTHFLLIPRGGLASELGGVFEK